MFKMLKFIIFFGFIAIIIIIGAQSLMTKQNPAIDPGDDDLLDLLISEELDSLREQNELEEMDLDALKKKAREKIRDIIKENQEELKSSLDAKLDEVVDNIIEEITEKSATSSLQK
jgi:hypothetical protein